MKHIPELVVERLSLFADPQSLVLLASCCRWLWLCVGLQHHAWRQHYHDHYTLKDDKELQWLSLYIRTLQLSGQFARSKRHVLDITRLSASDLPWFHAFCQRHATDTRWFSDRPYPLHGTIIEP